MTKKKLGILGGMGPKATAVFFNRIVDRTPASKDQDHIDTIILNHAGLPDRTESIERGEKGRSELLLLLQEDLKILESRGADVIAIPCNTVHFFYGRMQAMTALPILNMVEETLRFLSKKKPSNLRVGLFATDGTVRTGLYEKYAKHFGIEIVLPMEENQRIIMDSIYEFKASGKKKIPKVEKIFIEMLGNSCDVLLLACTELSCMEFDKETEECRVDALDVLADAAIRFCLEGR